MIGEGLRSLPTFGPLIRDEVKESVWPLREKGHPSGVFWHFDGLGPIGTRSDQGSIPCTSTNFHNFLLAKFLAGPDANARNICNGKDLAQNLALGFLKVSSVIS